MEGRADIACVQYDVSLLILACPQFSATDSAHKLQLGSFSVHSFPRGAGMGYKSLKVATKLFSAKY